jgi:hypothetical protein
VGNSNTITVHAGREGDILSPKYPDQKGLRMAQVEECLSSKHKALSSTPAQPKQQQKDTIKKIKTQITKWEKRFVNHISDKGLISKICKEFFKTQDEKNPYN